jgi:DNA-binding response OmpR family regulator
MGQKILVLDDDADILEVISYILIDKGYEVSTLESGENLFNCVWHFQPDLILMDVMLGGMDGRVLCSELKHCEETSLLPVILISATHDLAGVLRQDGAPDDFIAKPFDISLLTKKVKDQLYTQSTG